jgi:hypothetical protein
MTTGGFAMNEPDLTAGTLREASRLRRVTADTVFFNPNEAMDCFAALEDAGFDVDVDQNDIDEAGPAQDVLISIVTRQPLHEVMEAVNQLMGNAGCLAGYWED